MGLYIGTRYKYGLSTGWLTETTHLEGKVPLLGSLLLKNVEKPEN